MGKREVKRFMTLLTFVFWVFLIILCSFTAILFRELEDYTNMFLSLILLMLVYKTFDITQLNKQEVKTNGNN